MAAAMDSAFQLSQMPSSHLTCPCSLLNSLRFLQIARRTSSLAQQLGLAPVPTIDACLEMCLSDEGRALLSPGQTAVMQVRLVGWAAQGKCLDRALGLPNRLRSRQLCGSTDRTPQPLSSTLELCPSSIQIIALALLQRKEEALAMAETDAGEEDQVRAAATLRICQNLVCFAE